MPRPAKIWLRKQTGDWYATIRGRKLRLSKDRKEAERLFHRLKAEEEPPARAVAAPTFRKLADLYIEEGRREKSEKTFKLRLHFLQSFCDHVGRRRADELKVHMASEWLNRCDTWGRSTRATAVRVLKACLNWSVEQGYLEKNPLVRLKSPGYDRRERTLSAEERARIMAAAHPAFRQFVWALAQTGARPFSELAKLTAADIDWEAGTARLAEHKNAHRGKKRTLYFTPELLAVLRELAGQHPTGPLFRNSRGGIWQPSAAGNQCREIEKRLGIERFSLYALRHSLVSDALARGMTADVIGELIGNSPATIAAHYSHLDAYALPTSSNGPAHLFVGTPCGPHSNSATSTWETVA